MRNLLFVFLELIILCGTVRAQKVEIGSLAQPAKLVIHAASDSAALTWDNGDGQLHNGSDAILWNRAKFRLLLDADNNTVAPSQFSLFSGVNIGNNDDASVNFNLDGGDSWLKSGNFGIGTTNPNTDLEILGPNNTRAIRWDSSRTSLRHHSDMLVTERGWMRFLIDSDNDDANAQFALYNNKSASSGLASVRFHLDGGDSWIGLGNFGLGTDSPSEKLEVAGAVKIGDTANGSPAGGTLRWNGSDFEGYIGSQWTSLTASPLIQDDDGDTGISVEDGSDPDDMEFTIANTLVSRLSRNTGGKTVLAFPNNDGNVILGSVGNNTFSGGEDNIAIGESVALSNQNGVNNIFIGKQSAALATGVDSSVYIGNYIGAANSNGQNNVVVGHGASWQGTQFAKSTLIGSIAAQNIDQDEAVVIGFDAGNVTAGSSILRSVLIGTESGKDNEAGPYSTYVGFRSGAFLLGGEKNVAIGAHAITGDSAVAIGFQANAGFSSIAVGYESFGWTWSTAVGHKASASENNSIAIGSFTNANSDEVHIGNTFIDEIGGFQAWTNLSDGRVKTNVCEAVSGLEFVRKLRPVNYTIDYESLSILIGERQKMLDENLQGEGMDRFKQARNRQSKVRHSGFIAQEVEETVRLLGIDFNGVSVPQGENDTYGLRYSEFIPHIVRAIQEQHVTLEEKESEIQSLRQQLQVLMDRVAALEQD